MQYQGVKGIVLIEVLLILCLKQKSFVNPPANGRYMRKKTPSPPSLFGEVHVPKKTLVSTAHHNP